MSMESMAIIRRKRARGAVLALLEVNYPTGTAYNVMERMLADNNTAQAHELPGIVRYLEDKGYLQVEVPEEPELRPLAGGVLRLMAHGVDLMEGSLPEDPGIIF